MLFVELWIVASDFSRVIAVDFSAASSPTRGANSIWRAVAEDDGPIRTQNFATRYELANDLEQLVSATGRSLVVFDIALGWPAGFARSIGLSHRRAESTDQLLDELLDDERNNFNNRFDVANELNQRAGSPIFWGHPRGRTFSHLSPTTVGRLENFPELLHDKRLIEQNVGGVIKSPFQLTGAGAVGGQSLVGQVFVRRLKHRGLDISVWPFSERQSRVVIGEYYFSLTPWKLEIGSVPDQKQVRATVRWLRRELRSRRNPLSSDLFKEANSIQRRGIINEEGWLVGWPMRQRSSGAVTRLI